MASRLRIGTTTPCKLLFSLGNLFYAFVKPLDLRMLIKYNRGD